MSYAAEVTNAVPGIFSKKVVGNGLHLPASHPSLPSLLQYILINPTPSSSTISLHFIQQTKISSANWLLMELMMDH